MLRSTQAAPAHGLLCRSTIDGLFLSGLPLERGAQAPGQPADRIKYYLCLKIPVIDYAPVFSEPSAKGSKNQNPSQVIFIMQIPISVNRSAALGAGAGGRAGRQREPGRRPERGQEQLGRARCSHSELPQPSPSCPTGPWPSPGPSWVFHPFVFIPVVPARPSVGSFSVLRCCLRAAQPLGYPNPRKCDGFASLCLPESSQSLSLSGDRIHGSNSMDKHSSGPPVPAQPSPLLYQPGWKKGASLRRKLGVSSWKLLAGSPEML